MSESDEIGDLFTDKPVSKPDDTGLSFADIKTYTSQRQAKQALDAAVANLDVRDVSLYLNVGLIEILNLYKSHSKQNFSTTINGICEKHLSTLEELCPPDYDRWSSAYYDYITFTNLNKSVSDTILKHVFLPAKAVKADHRDIHVVLSKKNVDRIDSIKSTFIFKNSSRDVIITYLMSMSDFDDLPPVFVSAISDMLYNFKLDLDNFVKAITSGFLNVNTEVVKYLIRSGFLKSDIPLMLRYLKEVVNLCEYKINNKDVLIDEYINLIIHINNFISIYSSMFDVSDNMIKGYVDDINKVLKNLKHVIKNDD